MFDFGFIPFATITYDVLFIKYKKKMKFKQKQAKTANTYREESSIQLFEKSRFIVAVYLIGTFMVFTIIPDLTYLFVGINNNNETDLLLAACNILFALSNMADALIYIIFQRTICEIFFERIFRLFKVSPCSMKRSVRTGSHNNCVGVSGLSRSTNTLNTRF